MNDKCRDAFEKWWGTNHNSYTESYYGGWNGAWQARQQEIDYLESQNKALQSQYYNDGDRFTALELKIGTVITDLLELQAATHDNIVFQMCARMRRILEAKP